MGNGVSGVRFYPVVFGRLEIGPFYRCFDVRTLKPRCEVMKRRIKTQWNPVKGRKSTILLYKLYLDKSNIILGENESENQSS